MWFAPQVCNKTVHLVTPAVLKKLNMSSSNSKLKIVYHCLFRDAWFYFVAILFSQFIRQVWTGPHITFFNFSFSLIRSIAQWHKHAIFSIYYYLFFSLLMWWSLNHRLLRLIEGRWIAIREVLKGLGRMRNTHTESIVKEIFLLKMQAICRPMNRKSWPIVP